MGMKPQKRFNIEILFVYCVRTAQCVFDCGQFCRVHKPMRLFNELRKKRLPRIFREEEDLHVCTPGECGSQKHARRFWTADDTIETTRRPDSRTSSRRRLVDMLTTTTTTNGDEAGGAHQVITSIFMMLLLSNAQEKALWPSG